MNLIWDVFQLKILRELMSDKKMLSDEVIKGLMKISLV